MARKVGPGTYYRSPRRVRKKYDRAYARERERPPVSYLDMKVDLALLLAPK
jgi:hypothetical protein